MSLQGPKGAKQSRRWLWLAAVLAGAAALADNAYPLLGRPAPDFALHAVSGGNVRLSEHRGAVVALSFWSSRCTPCRSQLVELNRAFGTYRSAGLEVFAINVDDDQAHALSFAHGEPVSFPLLLDPGKSVSRSFQVDELPLTVLLDRGGIVRNVIRGYQAGDEEVYVQPLRKLLDE